MANQDQETQQIRQDISKRLRLSNKELWNSLSENERNAVIDEYYNIYDIEKIGIHQVLEHNRNLRLNFATLVMGAILGLLGALVVDAIQDYIPNSLLYDILVVAGFAYVIWWFFRDTNRFLSERLGEHKVLEYLIKQVKKNN